MGRFIWMDGTDDAVARQLLLIAQNVGQEPFKTLLSISAADAQLWQNEAAPYAYLQLELIPQVEDWLRTLRGQRDLIEVDSTPGPQTLTVPPFWAIFQTWTSKTWQSDFFETADTQIKTWKLVPGFTTDLQRQMGLYVPPAEGGSATKDSPRIIDVKATSGGHLRLRVFKGGHPQVEGRYVIDAGAPKFERTMQATLDLSVGGGAAHSVDLSCRFLERDNSPVSDWSAVSNVSSLA